jgi:hypothetical protein
MTRADQKTTTKLSTLFVDPFLRAAFEAAEDDGLAPALVEIDNPKTRNGGAAERPAAANRRVLSLMEA